ncbi:MAG: hypothetical protein F4X26_09720 [Chloroflexi bacterium]|nr:hypothetical protein [Chloroflexota bacterium]
MTSPTEPAGPDTPDDTTAAPSVEFGLAGRPPIVRVEYERHRTPVPILDAPVVALTLAVTLAFLMFVLIEPTPGWIALAGAVAAAAGTDRVLRFARPRPVELGIDPTPQVLLPALYALAAPVMVEELARGWWTLLAALGAGLGFGAIVLAQTHSVRPHEQWLAFARPVTSAAVYVTAFALFSLTYVFELGLAAALAAVALAAGLLAVELLRDGQADLSDTIAFGGVVALVVTQLRWALHYVPLDGYLAALALLLAFFLTGGLLHAHLTLQLRRAVVVQYVAVSALGGVLIIGARSAGLA